MHRMRVAGLLACLSIPIASFASETGSIVGGFADTNWQSTYVGEAVVFLCDAATGYPIDRETKGPIEFSHNKILADRCWYAVADEKKGSFGSVEKLDQQKNHDIVREGHQS